MTKIHGTAGWTTDPPAAILYAVEPVGLCVYVRRKRGTTIPRKDSVRFGSRVPCHFHCYRARGGNKNLRCKNDPICLDSRQMDIITEAFKIC